MRDTVCDPRTAEVVLSAEKQTSRGSGRRVGSRAMSRATQRSYGMFLPATKMRTLCSSVGTRIRCTATRRG